MTTDDQKKARVLHTRVPESLERELKDKANSLGLSVSTLVRNILGNAFDLVEDIVTDSAMIARSARSGLSGNAPPSSAIPEPTAGDPSAVLGWQESIILNRNALCERCNAILPKGHRAAIGVLERPGKKPIVCLNCLKELVDANASEPQSSSD